MRSSDWSSDVCSSDLKQYAEFGLPWPTVGFNLNTADAWAAGEGNLSGIWPTVWHHSLDTPASKAFVADFQDKHGKVPENRSEEHTSELQSLMRISYAVFCLKKKKKNTPTQHDYDNTTHKCTAT